MMKKVLMGIGLAAVIFAVVLISDKQEYENRDPEPTLDPVKLTEPGEVSDYIDPPGLGEHQVALNHLYVEIPYEKQNVNLRKRTTETDVFVDITDKTTGERLYTYGESHVLKDDWRVFRELPTKKGKMILEMVVEIDSEEALIQEVIGAGVWYDPMPDRVISDVVDTGSRSGEFPAEKVEVLARVDLDWDGDQESLYKGFVIGVLEN
ncbi:hypothetical protein NCCP2716_22440 [Sporosarcina sp. NCCP-2716]|uniref:hypothetical protein n=1 Tax=Sporosarcina sp. NCCP-2716 TaxID=2943679 RepID=UPI00203D5E1C|nr:hypothetical protein [Sporosarcina sp. NCCP-2716]GKV69746.1 hypothetical protein NCCP2716_22440 [Sporosarcina sp. NCCP-2716]